MIFIVNEDPSHPTLETPNDDTHLPGYGLPLNYDPRNSEGKRTLFKNALHPKDLGEDSAGGKMGLLTLREITMMQIVNELTDKEHWDSKIFDDNILQKWRYELLKNETRDITPAMIDWCFSELKYKAELYRKTGAISTYKGDVVKSDKIIPSSLKEELKAAVVALEDVPDSEKDWHPGSDGKVLDLVHPSLFPLVYGRSRILGEDLASLEHCIEQCGKGEILPIPSEEDTAVEVHDWSESFDKPYSQKFQWLPCQVDMFSPEDDKVRITSYINNLHPMKHKRLYEVIERLIGHAIPMWNVTLTPLQRGRKRTKNRISYIEAEYFEIPPEEIPPRQEGETEWEYGDRKDEWIRDHQEVILPDASSEFSAELLHIMNEGLAGGSSGMDLRKTYSQKGLQIIVKLANICLTPTKPEYNGGTWHVEGQLNEHICASAIYYYDCHNVTPSRLSFRHQSDVQAASRNIDYEQSDHAWLEPVFGCRQDESGVQFLGSIETREGRLITFPNILQHQVQPFKLQDPTKPGHRKIMALFLVDPNIKIISTANVPCQRKDWWAESVMTKNTTHNQRGLSKLPNELRDLVFDGVEEFPISIGDAKKLREELMEERKEYRIAQDSAFDSVCFSLCEH